MTQRRRKLSLTTRPPPSKLSTMLTPMFYLKTIQVSQVRRWWLMGPPWTPRT